MNKYIKISIAALIVIAVCVMTMPAKALPGEFNIYPQGDASKEMISARCAGLADMLGMDLIVLKRHTEKARSLGSFRFAIELGFVGGIIVGMNINKSDKDIKNSARVMYKSLCSE